MINSVFAVIDQATGAQLMHVVDAVNHNDPSWSPPNTIRIDIDPEVYGSFKAQELDDHIITEGLKQNVAVKSALSAISKAMSLEEIRAAKEMAAQASMKDAKT